MNFWETLEHFGLFCWLACSACFWCSLFMIFDDQLIICQLQIVQKSETTRLAIPSCPQATSRCGSMISHHLERPPCSFCGWLGFSVGNPRAPLTPARKIDRLSRRTSMSSLPMLCVFWQGSQVSNNIGWSLCSAGVRTAPKSA